MDERDMAVAREGMAGQSVPPDDELRETLQRMLSDAEKALAYHSDEVSRAQVVRCACLAGLEQYPAQEPEKIRPDEYAGPLPRRGTVIG